MKRDAMAAVKAIERDEMKKKWMEKQHTRCASETHIEAHRAVMALYYNRGNKHNRTNTHSHTITLVSQTVGDQIFFSPFPTFTPCIRPSHRIPFAQSVEMLFFSSCHQVIRHRWKVWRRRRTWRGDVLCANARKRTNAMFSFNFFCRSFGIVSHTYLGDRFGILRSHAIFFLFWLFSSQMETHFLTFVWNIYDFAVANTPTNK